MLAAVRPAIVASFKGKDPLAFQGVDPTGEHGITYSFPNLNIDHAMRNTHVPPSFWRGVNVNQNAIFVETFMDELAEATGVDTVEFRRKHIAEYPRAIAVLNAVADGYRLDQAGCTWCISWSSANALFWEPRCRGLRDFG